MIESQDISLTKRTQHPNAVKSYMSKGLGESDARNAVATNLTLERARKETARYKELLIIDPLTGLYNRRHLDGDGSNTVLDAGMLKREFDEALRSHHDLSILMIDIDDFRLYNNLYSHPEGDNALKAIAGLVRKSIRSTDLPFRYGGEELLILLPETNIEAATIVAERLRKIIEMIQTLRTKLTISVGVATFSNSDEYDETAFNSRSVTTRKELVQLADDALYYSKKAGKNQVTVGNKLTDDEIEAIHPLR